MSSVLPDDAAVFGRRPSNGATTLLWTPRVARGEPWKALAIKNPSLRAHCRQLHRRVNQPRWVTLRPLIAALLGTVEERSRILVSSPWPPVSVVDGLLRMVGAGEWWLQWPETWQPEPDATAESQWAALVRHLFGPHAVPLPFADCWLRLGSWSVRECAIHAHLARGGSIRDLPGIPRLRKSAAALLWETPSHVGGLAAVRFAQLRSLRCTRPLIRVVMQSQAAFDFSNDGLWMPLLEKLRDAPKLPLALVPCVLDGMRHVADTCGSKRARDLLRLPANHLLRHWQNAWTSWDAVAFPDGTEPGDPIRDASRRTSILTLLTCRWRPMSDVPAWSQRSASRRHSVAWSVVELTSLRELIDEGRSMHHCVRLYSAKCRRGRAAIFHVACRRNGIEDRTAACTVEVDPATRRIVQRQGPYDRTPAGETLDLIREWARTHSLRLRR